jgi:membrane-bound lytic murein transglycosylase D
VSLIRLIFPALLAVSAWSMHTLAHAEELLALNSPVIDTAEPRYLPTARNIMIELLPLEPAAQQSSLYAPTTQDLWVRIRSGFSLSELDSKLVAKHEKWYARHPDYVDRMTDRARRYLFYITEEVERRGMPAEIALLPMVESAFNPGAYSHSSASGIWQFIPSTGKKFGMEQNWWYDGRRDVINATNGALDYLQKLHDMFGDWELALAAYNCGEGAVQRAQAYNRKHGRPTNYASLKLLKETRNYVPKLIAIKNIISDPAKFALSLPNIPNKPYFAVVATSNHMDVKLAAELADISEEEFTALNPAHTRPVILQDNTDLILLPIEKMNTFTENLENYDKPLVTWQSYQPKKGERLDKLAPRFGMSVENLKLVNGISRHGNISNGQTLLVPVNDEASESEFEVFNMHLADDHGRATRHRVRRGETLSHIARRYHVSVANLRRWNGPSRVKIIRPGQIITVARPATYSSSNSLKNKTKVF